MTWTPEQAALRRMWGLDDLDARAPAVTAAYHRDLERIAAREMAREAAAIAGNGHSPMPEEAELMAPYADRSIPLDSISMDPAPPMLIERLDPLGHTILYGTGGVGKGSVACWWIVQLIRDGHRVLVLDYEGHPEEWSRRIGSLDPGVHISGLVRHLTPSAPIRRAAAEIAWTCDTHELDYIVVDSAVMAVGADPLKPEAAAEYAAALLAIGHPALTLAHVTKTDDSRYPFGSIFWHNLARMTWSLTGDDGETLLRHRKHNNYQGLGTFSLAITWSEDGRLREVFERGYNATILRRALDALGDADDVAGASLGDLLTAVNDGEHKTVTRDTLRRTLSKATPMQVRSVGDRYFHA